MKIICFIVLMVCSFGNAWGGPYGFNLGRWTLTTEGEFYQTQDNFDDTGRKYSLLSNSFSQYTIVQTVRYDLSNQVSIFTSMNGSQAYAHNNFLGIDRSRTSLNEVTFGADMLFATPYFDVIPEAKFVVPLVSVDYANQNPIPSEGSYKTQGGIYITKDLSPLLLIGYLGAQYRTSRSTIVPWSAHVAADLGKFMFDAEIGGYSTLVDDPDTNNIRATNQRLGAINVSNAGSYRYYTINPTLIEGKVWGGIRMGNEAAFQLGYSTALAGVRNAVGQAILVNFTLGFDGDPHSTITTADRRSGFTPNADEEPVLRPMKSRNKVRAPKRKPKPNPTINLFDDDQNPTTIQLKKRKSVQERQ